MGMFGAIATKLEELIELMKKISFLAALFFASASCSSNPDTELSVPETQEIGSSGLAAQKLEKGDCGLFLWNRTDSSTFLFFQRAGETSALFYENGEVSLTNISNDGRLFGQFYTQSQWRLSDERTLRLSIDPGEAINGGQRITGGVISSTNSDGWEVKTPVAGVTACMEE